MSLVRRLGPLLAAGVLAALLAVISAQGDWSNSNLFAVGLIVTICFVCVVAPLALLVPARRRRRRQDRIAYDGDPEKVAEPDFRLELMRGISAGRRQKSGELRHTGDLKPRRSKPPN
jgi:hypothetical protein